MSDHWLILERDEAYIAKFGEDPDHPERTYRIECSDPAACPGWIECFKGHDGVSDDDRDRGQDGEEVMIHGEAHTYRYGYGWCVDYPGCPVQSAALDGDDHLDIARTHGLGRHPIDEEWDDEYCRITATEATR